MMDFDSEAEGIDDYESYYEAVNILADGSECETQVSTMPSSEETENKVNYEEIIKRLKDEHDKEMNQMREDYGFVIATLKLGSSSDAIIDLQAKINEHEHEMERMKTEFSVEKVNLMNKVKRAESANMFALRRNEEMSNKIYVMQVELEEMDDKHQAEIESYQEKLAALGGEKDKNKETEKQGGNLKNKRKLMKKELEELRNEHERKMESFANKIQEQKNIELKEMSEKISKLESLIDEMKLGHIRAIKSIEESHRDENIESLNKERERVRTLEAEHANLKSENEKTIEDLNKKHKEEVDKLRRYYEKEIGELKRRKISKSQALRRKTSVDTASLILKALKEQNEKDEQEENDKKKNSNIEHNSVKNFPQSTVDDMDLQKSMEKIRLIYSEEFNKSNSNTSISDEDKVGKLLNDNNTLSQKLNILEEKHKNEIQAMTEKYNEMKSSLENKIYIIKNNENINANKFQNTTDKNEDEKESRVRSIKQSIQRFDKRMETLREMRSVDKDIENAENKNRDKEEFKSLENGCKEKQCQDVEMKENVSHIDTKINSKNPLSECNGNNSRASVEITLKMGQNQESIISRKTSVVLPDSPKDSACLTTGSSSPRTRTNISRKVSGTVQRRKTLYENIYSGVLPSEGNKT